MRTRLAITLSCSASLLGCGGDDAATVDAGTVVDAQSVSDGSTLGDAAAPLGWVDFAISGCASGAGTEASPCLGASPLQLRLTVLAPAMVDTQVWNFGDDSGPNMESSPQHLFKAPGSYNLSLNVEGPGGTAGVTKLAAVVVIPAPLGSSCSASSHCASGQCVCDASADCAAPLADGMCVLDCDSSAVCGSNICVNLDPTAVADADWRRTTCLPSCDDGTCSLGKSCQALLDVDGSWTQACLPAGLLQPMGASCRDFEGNLTAAQCASGQCLDLGVRGVCSFACDLETCPGGSACATWDSGDPAPHCLADCDALACDSDPGLSCEAPGSDWTVDETPVLAGYCSTAP